MDIVLHQKGEFSKIFLAYYSEKKLTKAAVNSIDLTKSVDSMIDSEKTLSLRVSGQLIIGILRILVKQCTLLLLDLEEFLSHSSDPNPKPVDKEPITAITQNITLSDRKKRLISLEDTFSTSSFVKSSRESIEIGRNTAQKDAITLNEINYTPRSAIASSTHDLDPAENFLHDITPADSMHELEPMAIDTPEIAIDLSTPATQHRRALFKEKEKARSSAKKYKPKRDLQTIQEIATDPDLLRKEHQMYGGKTMALDSTNLFFKHVLEIPNELKELYGGNMEWGKSGGKGVESAGAEVENAQEVDQHREDFQDNQDLEPLTYANEGNEEMANGDARDVQPLTDVSEDLLKIIQSKPKTKKILFESIVGKDRNEAAKAFYSLMIIASKGLVVIEQETYFDNILIKSW